MTDETDIGLAWSILDRYVDPATARFDEVLNHAGVDAESARALRFWQRQSVAAVKHYAAEAVPRVLTTLTDVDGEVAETVARADATLEALAPPAMVPRVAPPARPDLVVLRRSYVVPNVSSREAPLDALELRRQTVAARLAQSG